MARLTYRDLCTSTKAQLETYMAGAKGPSLESISGWAFRGWNVLAPHERLVMVILQNTRFFKCFFPAKDGSGQLVGYNLKVKNGGLDDPWTCRPSDEQPASQGHYKVYPTRNRPGKNRYPNAVFLDYAQPENNLFTGSTIDDYLVQPDPENPDLLMGKAYTHLGILTPATFFILERARPHAG